MDTSLRDAQRGAEACGGLETRARAIRRRMRAGRLPLEQVVLAARLGDPAARAVLGNLERPDPVLTFAELVATAERLGWGGLRALGRYAMADVADRARGELPDVVAMAQDTSWLLTTEVAGPWPQGRLAPVRHGRNCRGIREHAARQAVSRLRAALRRPGSAPAVLLEVLGCLVESRAPAPPVRPVDVVDRDVGLLRATPDLERVLRDIATTSDRRLFTAQGLEARLSSATSSGEALAALRRWLVAVADRLVPHDASSDDPRVVAREILSHVVLHAVSRAPGAPGVEAVLARLRVQDRQAETKGPLADASFAVMAEALNECAGARSGQRLFVTSRRMIAGVARHRAGPEAWSVLRAAGGALGAWLVEVG